MFDTIWDVIMPSIWMCIGWFTGALAVEKRYSKKWEDYQRKVSHIIKLYQLQLGRKTDGIL